MCICTEPLQIRRNQIFQLFKFNLSLWLTGDPNVLTSVVYCICISLYFYCLFSGQFMSMLSANEKRIINFANYKYHQVNGAKRGVSVVICRQKDERMTHTPADQYQNRCCLAWDNNDATTVIFERPQLLVTHSRNYMVTRGYNVEQGIGEQGRERRTFHQFIIRQRPVVNRIFDQDLWGKSLGSGRDMVH